MAGDTDRGRSTRFVAADRQAPVRDTSEQHEDQDAGRISRRLAGRHVLLTGVTGFVGEALLHLLLSEVPGVHAHAAGPAQGVDAGRDADPHAAGQGDLHRRRRGRRRHRGRCWRTGSGSSRATSPTCPPLPDDLDAVVHCAGDVSFDPPVDEGFTHQRARHPRAARRGSREAGPDVHYVHISTAYVAGRRRGSIPEGPVDHAVDLEAELAWGLASARPSSTARAAPSVLARAARRGRARARPRRRC